MRFEKKFLNLFIVTIICFIINMTSTLALNIKLNNVEVYKKGGSVSTDEIIINNEEISNIVFNKINDYVIFKMTIENNESKNYTIDSISDNNKNENINISYKYDTKDIKSKGTKDIFVTLKYNKKVYNNTITLNDFLMTLNLKDNNGNSSSVIINPTTGDNIKIYVILFIIALIVMLFVLLLIKHRKGKKALLFLLVLIPLTTLAKESLKINVKFSDIKVIGEKLPYTISIKDSEGSITEKIYYYDDTLGELPAVSKNGYTFDKYVDQDNNEVTSETVVKGNMTITPLFNVITYNISYNLNGGEATNKDKYTVEDEIVLNNPTKLGYTFSGWTGSNGDSLQTRVTINKGTTGNLSYTANWSANQDTKYTVIHKYPNLDNTYEEETEVLRGATDSEVTPALKEKTGFKGPDNLQTVRVSADGSTTVIYTYTRESYMLTVEDEEYVEPSNVSKKYLYGTEVTLSAKARNHYEFTRWSNNETDNEITITIENDITIKPLYKLSNYDVIFNPNGGTGTMSNQLINCDESTKLNKNTFTKSGYNFIEWNTKSDGTGKSYYDEEELLNISTTENIELYAIWVEETYVALVNGNYYTTLQAAVLAVPTDNTETKVKLLKNVSEKITVAKNKNIVFDFGNFTLSNKDNNNVMVIDGSVKMQNGTIASNADNGAIDINSTGSFIMTGGKIVATGTKQAIYNGGYTKISGNSYLSNISTSRAAVQNFTDTAILVIESGTITSDNYVAVKIDKGNLIVGVKDGNVDSTTPLIKGKLNAISSNVNFSMYDGILKSLKNGSNMPIQDEKKLVEMEDNSDMVYDTETIDDQIYNVEYIEHVVKHTITFNPNGGETSETTRKITNHKEIDLLPIATKSGVYFAGWYTGLTDGVRIDSNYIPTSDITLYARWSNTDPFPKLFEQTGACTFNGSNANITGSDCSNYTNSKYIDTGIYLFNSENYKKDFELYIELDEFNPSIQESSTHATIIASKDEIFDETIVPGFVLRANGEKIGISIAKGRKNPVTVEKKYRELTSIKITRIDGKVYYSFNGEDMQLLLDMRDFNDTFEFPVTIGAALNYNKEPFRFLKATVSNMYIKVGKYNG